MTQYSRFVGWHPNAIKKQLAKEAQERQTRRKEWLKTADVRRIKYCHIAALSTVELIHEVGYLGSGDDYDGGITRQGQLEFDFAKRTLRERIWALEAETTRLREELEVTRSLLRDAPYMSPDKIHGSWYDAVCDYLETCE